MTVVKYEVQIHFLTQKVLFFPYANISGWIWHFKVSLLRLFYLLHNFQFQKPSILIIFHSEKKSFFNLDYQHLNFSPNYPFTTPTQAVLHFHSCFTLFFFFLCPLSEISKEVQKNIKHPCTSAYCFTTDMPSQLKYSLIKVKAECVKLLVKFFRLRFKPQLNTTCTMSMLIFLLTL